VRLDEEAYDDCDVRSGVDADDGSSLSDLDDDVLTSIEDDESGDRLDERSGEFGYGSRSIGGGEERGEEFVVVARVGSKSDWRLDASKPMVGGEEEKLGGRSCGICIVSSSWFPSWPWGSLGVEGVEEGGTGTDSPSM
jgi:hypothetical protein